MRERVSLNGLVGVHFVQRDAHPIPFSLALFGVSVFCLANIKYSSEKEKLTSILFFILGIYMASVLSYTRGTILASLLAVPIVVVITANYLQQSHPRKSSTLHSFKGTTDTQLTTFESLSTRN